MQKNNILLEQKRFQRLSEAVIGINKASNNDLLKVKALVESFNNKYKTRFYFDDKRHEIVHANLIKENRFAQYKKLSSLLERSGIKSKIKESTVPHLNGLSRLMESELAQAEIILAAQSIADRLQKMAEDLAQMVSEDVLPISDQMKSVFGSDLAEKWNNVSKEALEDAFETISKTKDAISSSNLVLEKKLEGEETVANDMMDFGDKENTTDVDSDLDSLDSEDDSMDDLLGGSDAASGPDTEPLGRAKKESKQYKKKSLKENQNTRQPGELGPSDFDFISRYNGYILAADVHDDGDVVKHTYYILKPTRSIEIGNGYKPMQLYKKVKNLGLGSFASEREAILLFKKTVDGISTSMNENSKMYPEISKIEKMGYNVNMSMMNGVEYFAISKENDFDEFTGVPNILHVFKTKSGEYMIDMDYKAKFKRLEDAVSYHFDDTPKYQNLDEHKNYDAYVNDLKNKGFTVDVSKSGESLIFIVSKNGKTGIIEEPKTGVYQVMAFDEEYSSLEDAVNAFFGITENEEMIKERNAFAYAVQKAKAAGHDEFELDGKKYKVEESEMDYDTYPCKGKHYKIKKSSMMEDSMRDQGGSGNSADRGTVKPIKGSTKFWAKNLDGTMKIFNTKKEAEEFAETGLEEMTEDNTELAKRALDTLEAGKKVATRNRVDPQKSKLVKDLDDAITKNPKLKKTISDLVGETITEDISMGIKESVAIRNAAIIHNITLSEAQIYWKNKK